MPNNGSLVQGAKQGSTAAGSKYECSQQ